MEDKTPKVSSITGEIIKDDNPRILVNRIKTPDGTILESKFQHDYVSHIDKNGHTYAVDGGMHYLKRTYPASHYNKRNWFQKTYDEILYFLFDKEIDNPLDYEELSIYETDDFEKIRRNFRRVSRGKRLNEGISYVKLCDMSDNWLKHVLALYDNLEQESFGYKLYEKEIEYRKLHGIEVREDINIEKVGWKYITINGVEYKSDQSVCVTIDDLDYNATIFYDKNIKGEFWYKWQIRTQLAEYEVHVTLVDGIRPRNNN